MFDSNLLIALDVGRCAYVHCSYERRIHACKVQAYYPFMQTDCWLEHKSTLEALLSGHVLYVPWLAGHYEASLEEFCQKLDFVSLRLTSEAVLQ